VVFVADPLAAHSGATVRDFHPLPFSLAVAGEHLGPFYEYHTAMRGSNSRRRREACETGRSKSEAV
jgi:hypothetical protein